MMFKKLAVTAAVTSMAVLGLAGTASASHHAVKVTKHVTHKSSVTPNHGPWMQMTNHLQCDGLPFPGAMSVRFTGSETEVTGSPFFTGHVITTLVMQKWNGAAGWTSVASSPHRVGILGSGHVMGDMTTAYFTYAHYGYVEHPRMGMGVPFFGTYKMATRTKVYNIFGQVIDSMRTINGTCTFA